MSWWRLCLTVTLHLLLLSPALSIDEDRCNYLFHKYLTKYHKTPVPLDQAQLLYFLHIPRTAGRSFFFCFLKRGTPPLKRCPKSYDHLRVDPNLPDCWLLSSHDDYSIVPMLSGQVAVATQLRNPVDRVISAYEFSVEIASRERRRFQLGLPAMAKPRLKTVTTEVWPWSLLVPHMVGDMKRKLDKMKMRARARAQQTSNTQQGSKATGLEIEHETKESGRKLEQADVTPSQSSSLPPPKSLDPYNNTLVQSLHDFVSAPIAAELLHNGAFFQILGITNYSHNPFAAELRTCSYEHASIRQNLMSLAKEYLSKFVHVGTTDLLYESVASAAVSLELPIHGPSYMSNTDIFDFKQTANASLPGRRLHSKRRAALYKYYVAYPNASSTSSVHPLHTGQTLVTTSFTNNAPADTKAVGSTNNAPVDTKADGITNNHPADTKEDPLQSTSPKAQPQSSGVSRFFPLSSLINWTPLSNAWSRLLHSQPGAQSTAGDSTYAEPNAAPADWHGTLGQAGKTLQRYLNGASSKFQWLQKKGTDPTRTSKAPSVMPIRPKDPKVETAKRGQELGREFMTCTTRRQTKATEMRNKGLANMKNEDGEGLRFSKAARKALPAATIELIRSLNQQDMELYEYATELLKAKRKQYTDDGKLRELPNTDLRTPLLTDRVGLQPEATTTGNDSGELR